MLTIATDMPEKAFLFSPFNQRVGILVVCRMNRELQQDGGFATMSRYPEGILMTFTNERRYGLTNVGEKAKSKSSLAALRA